MPRTDTTTPVIVTFTHVRMLDGILARATVFAVLVFTSPSFVVTRLSDLVDRISALGRARLRPHGVISMITRKTTRIVTSAFAAVLGAGIWATVGQAAGPV